ncbi:hypothetical protein APS67_005799 [Streptomyces sp. AVP053U2]|nr:hypothetical protein APS67_005799 [Streptomyces sp. AVP053U2]
MYASEGVLVYDGLPAPSAPGPACVPFPPVAAGCTWGFPSRALSASWSGPWSVREETVERPLASLKTDARSLMSPTEEGSSSWVPERGGEVYGVFQVPVVETVSGRGRGAGFGPGPDTGGP